MADNPIDESINSQPLEDANNRELEASLGGQSIIDSPVVNATTENGVASNAETESIDSAEEPADLTAALPTAGRKIVIIQPPEAVTRRRLSVSRALLAVAAEHQATVAASNGQPWLVTQAHIDSPKSSKYGISLAAGLQALGIERLQRGDLVQIEIGRNDTCYRLTGRASRKAAAYFAKTDLAQACVELHTPFHYVILGVESESQVEGRQL